MQSNFDINNSWRIFRIMAEFVEGFEELQDIGPVVTVYGSARTTPDAPWYKRTVELSRQAVRAGFGVMTGGGGGLMEAANRGAYEEGGMSVGLNIDLPMEIRWLSINLFKNWLQIQIDELQIHIICQRGIERELTIP